MLMFLDMDGVVSDAHGAFLKQLGREDLLVPGQYPAGVDGRRDPRGCYGVVDEAVI